MPISPSPSSWRGIARCVRNVQGRTTFPPKSHRSPNGFHGPTRHWATWGELWPSPLRQSKYFDAWRDRAASCIDISYIQYDPMIQHDITIVFCFEISQGWPSKVCQGFSCAFNAFTCLSIVAMTSFRCHSETPWDVHCQIWQ